MNYFVTYLPYSDVISRVYYQVGETPSYIKVRDTATSTHEFMVRKSNFLIRGGDIRFVPMQEEELKEKLARQRNLSKLRKLDFKKLTNSQLERIRKIVEEK